MKTYGRYTPMMVPMYVVWSNWAVSVLQQPDHSAKVGSPRKRQSYHCNCYSAVYLACSLIVLLLLVYLLWDAGWHRQEEERPDFAGRRHSYYCHHNSFPYFILQLYTKLYTVDYACGVCVLSIIPLWLYFFDQKSVSTFSFFGFHFIVNLCLSSAENLQ